MFGTHLLDFQVGRTGITASAADRATGRVSTVAASTWHKENTEADERPSASADRVEIEVLRGEFTDAVMMSDYDRVASLFM
jgi:hypothetical protein